MAKCKQYDGITKNKLTELRETLKNEGIEVPPVDRGRIKGPHGIELDFSYEENTQTLKMCVIKKSFYVPEAKIWEVIDGAIYTL